MILFCLVWTLVVSGMRLNIEKVTEGEKIKVTVLSENLTDTHTFLLDKRNTLMHLYSIVSVESGFDEDNFQLYLGDTLLPPSPSPLFEHGLCMPHEFLSLRIIPSSPLPTDLDQNADVGKPVRKILPADSIGMFSPRLRTSLPKLKRPSTGMEPMHVRTPRNRIRKSKVDCYHRLPVDQHQLIKQAFYEDILQSQKLTLILEERYPELIEAMFEDLPKFFQLLTPELMIIIDQIEEVLKETGEYLKDNYEDASKEEANTGILANEVLHVMVSVNGVEIPLLFDCMSIDTTMSFGALFKAYPTEAGPPVLDDVIQITLALNEGTTILVPEMNFVHDSEPWIVAGLEFMNDNAISINFADNEVIISGISCPFA